jgi:hypothetical protein
MAEYAKVGLEAAQDTETVLRGMHTHKTSDGFP